MCKKSSKKRVPAKGQTNKNKIKFRKRNKYGFKFVYQLI